MRPATLAETIDRIHHGEARENALPEFLDEFYLAQPHGRLAMLLSEPALTGEPRLDALAGAVAEYLARQYDLWPLPKWCFADARYLEHAWHTSPFTADAFREYLTFASPAEFSSRNIFTEERPLRRARSALADSPSSTAAE